MTEQEEEIKLELIVKESPIEAEDGVARINDAVLKKLGAEEGHSIQTSTDEKTVLLTVYADKLIDQDKISIRPDDREKLGVMEGDKVTISPHKTVGKAWDEKKEAFKDKLSETKEDLKEKLELGQDDDEEDESKN
jgi:formylmethanofuran dehydrogenase subunit D